MKGLWADWGKNRKAWGMTASGILAILLGSNIVNGEQATYALGAIGLLTGFKMRD